MMKSKEELYFSYYLEELKDAGFVKEWSYESDTFKLSDSISLPYCTNSKKGVLAKEEHILRKSSLTADFTICWNFNKSKNIFVLHPGEPISINVKLIPFRIGIISEDEVYSYVEVKASNEIRTSSSISFPYKQKWVYDKYGIYVQKIKPFHPTKKSNILFQNTFTPMNVIRQEVYKIKCPGGNVGDSKLKYPVRTLQDYLKLFIDEKI